VVGAGEDGALVTFRGNLLETGVDPVSRTTLNGIVFTNGLFVAVGNRGLILTSLDGRGWVPRSSSTDKDLLSIVCGPSGLVAVGEDGRIVASTDGFAWRTVNSPAAIHLTRAAFVNGRYYALGDAGTLLESMNGTNWTARVIQIPGREPALGNIAFNHGLYVAAGGYHDENGFARSFIAVSQDGVAWAPQLEVNFGVKLRGIISHGDGYVVIGNDGLIAASVDGFRWRHQELGAEGENFRTLAVLPDGVLVAAGNRGMVCSSVDGTNWIRNRVITSKNLHDAAYGRESLVAVATDGTILVAEHLLPKLIPAGPKTASDITLHVELGLRDLYLLQESEDLLSWRNLQLFTNGTSSNVFRGVLPPPNRQRFYRLGWH
jgi:hypothetical protein